MVKFQRKTRMEWQKHFHGFKINVDEKVYEVFYQKTVWRLGKNGNIILSCCAKIAKHDTFFASCLLKVVSHFSLRNMWTNSFLEKSAFEDFTPWRQIFSSQHKKQKLLDGWSIIWESHCIENIKTTHKCEQCSVVKQKLTFYGVRLKESHSCPKSRR